MIWGVNGFGVIRFFIKAVVENREFILRLPTTIWMLSARDKSM